MTTAEIAFADLVVAVARVLELHMREGRHWQQAAELLAAKRETFETATFGDFRIWAGRHVDMELANWPQKPAQVE